MSSCQPYRDFRKKDKAPSPGAAGGGTLGSQGAPTKRAVGRVNRFGVTSFTSIRDSQTTKEDAYSFDEEPNSGELLFIEHCFSHLWNVTADLQHISDASCAKERSSRSLIDNRGV